MKTLAQTILAVSLVVIPVASFAAQGFVTLTCQGTNSPNALILTENEVATVKSYLDLTMSMDNGYLYGGASVQVSKGADVLSVYAKSAFFYGPSGYGVDPIKNFTVAGPARIELLPPGGVTADFWALLTLEIKPTPFAPDKATTIGPLAGDVTVTMETSTNLVDWMNATNGLVYTNSPAARFFRIKMEKTTNP